MFFAVTPLGESSQGPLKPIERPVEPIERILDHFKDHWRATFKYQCDSGIEDQELSRDPLKTSEDTWNSFQSVWNASKDLLKLLK